MSKSRIDGTSDYAKVVEQLNAYKKLVDHVLNIRHEIDILIEDKRKAEHTLRVVEDLINSNEELTHFSSVKKELRKPIEDYFKKVK